MLTLLAVATALALPVEAVPNPRGAGGWVTDLAGVLPDDAEDRLDARIEALHRDLGVEIAVVTVQDVAPRTPKSFSTALFNHWGIGSAEKNDGLLVLLVLGERRLEMETGVGLEPVLTDRWLSQMQARAMVPSFKAGDYGAGIEAGLAEVEPKLRAEAGAIGSVATLEDWRGQEAPSAPPALPRVPAHEPAGRRLDRNVALGGAGAGLLGLFGVGGLVLRRRRRTCPQCELRMLSLDEVADDAHLDAGQRKEEEVRSVNWEVVICPSCQFSREISHRRWFSGYRRCPSCKHRTCRRASTTLVAATYDHGGQVRVTEDCAHCSHHETWTRSTPARTRPSSSSSSSSSGSSSSSSFGGGYSRGGGSGSSW